MHYPSQTVIALDMSKDSADLYTPIHRMDFLKESDITFVHCVLEPYYSGDGVPISQFPRIDTRSFIEAGVLAKMKEMAQKILPHDYKGNVRFDCLFSDSPKKEFLNFIETRKVDLTIIATPEDRSFFHSSFASYVGMRSSSDVFILRSIPDKIHRFKGHLKVIYGLKIKPSSQGYASLKKFDFLDDAKVLMLHLAPVSNYQFLKDLKFSTLPTLEEQVVVEEFLRHKMNSLKKDILPDHFKGTCEISCVFSEHVKNDFTQISDEMNADLVILTPDNHKYFGGFINFQIMNARSNILLLKS